jgi:hypothetical protein
MQCYTVVVFGLSQTQKNIKMKIYQRSELSKKEIESGRFHKINGDSMNPMPNDEFLKVSHFGLFEWNKDGLYPIQKAVSIHYEPQQHETLVCRPVRFFTNSQTEIYTGLGSLTEGWF